MNPIIATFHKAGTVILHQTIRKYCQTKGIDFLHTRLQPGKNQKHGQIIFEDHFDRLPSRFDLNKIDYRCIVVYRHPMEIIMSGVRYHQVCQEKPVMKKIPELGKTYREHLCSLSMNDKIFFEMENIGGATIKAIETMLDFPHTKYFKLEDLRENPRKLAKEICDWLKLDAKVFTICLVDVLNNHTKHMTNKSGTLYTYQKHFKDKHYDQFNKLFPNILSKLNYSK